MFGLNKLLHLLSNKASGFFVQTYLDKGINT